jgi:predicted nucleic acid-binding protein
VIAVSRPTKSAAKSAEKPAIIWLERGSRKQPGIFPGQHRADNAACRREDNPIVRFSRATTPVSLPMSSSLPSPPVPCAVIDTNVLMDWLVFRNPGCAPLVDALETTQVRWIATQSMRDELAHVLGRGIASTYSPDRVLIDSTWDRLCHLVDAPLPTLVPRLRCTDQDDQKFIDLALNGARWLISRDRAVLKLGKRAAALGVVFTTPERWANLPA